MRELYRARFKIGLWTQKASPVYYARIADEDDESERRRSTGVMIPTGRATQKTREKAEKQAMQVARELCDRIIEKEEAARNPQPEGILFEKAYADWIESLSVREKTIADYRRDGDCALVPMFSGRLVRDITSKDAMKIRACFKEHAKITRKKYVGRLGMFMRWAMAMGYATTDPTVGLPRLTGRGKKPPRTKIAITPDQARKLLSACRGNRIIKIEPNPKGKRPRERHGYTMTRPAPDKLFIATMLGLYAGLRTETIQKIRWCDVDFRQRKLVIPPEFLKNEDHLDGSVEIPIHHALLRSLRERRTTGKQVTTEDPVVGTMNNFRRNLQVASQRCGLAKELIANSKQGRDITPHDLRRTYSTWLEFEARAPRSVTKLLRGDKLGGSEDVADLYMDPKWKDKEEAINALPDLISGAKTATMADSAS